jgi:hypothetical protein
MNKPESHRKEESRRKLFVPPLFAVLMLAAILASRGLVTSHADPVAIEVIQRALANLPLQIGQAEQYWIKTREVPVPTGQAHLLGLSAFMSREYRRLQTFPPVTAILFIAHCGDSRSMSGHHPPNCYPSSGWTLGLEQSFTWEVPRSDGRVMEASAYHFSEADDSLSNLWVINGFFMSGNFFAATLEEAERVAKPSLLGGNGLSQFQILLQGDYPAVDVEKYGTEILQGIPSFLFDVTSGDSPDQGESSDWELQVE